MVMVQVAGFLQTHVGDLEFGFLSPGVGTIAASQTSKKGHREGMRVEHAFLGGMIGDRHWGEQNPGCMVAAGGRWKWPPAFSQGFSRVLVGAPSLDSLILCSGTLSLLSLAVSKDLRAPLCVCGPDLSRWSAFSSDWQKGGASFLPSTAGECEPLTTWIPYSAAPGTVPVIACGGQSRRPGLSHPWCPSSPRGWYPPDQARQVCYK